MHHYTPRLISHTYIWHRGDVAAGSIGNSADHHPDIGFQCFTAKELAIIRSCREREGNLFTLPSREPLATPTAHSPNPAKS